MIPTRDPNILEILKGGKETKDQRKYLCENEPVYFCIYYFPRFFTYPIAPFQWEFYDDFKRLIRGDLREVAWIAFRESAKTSIAKMLITWAICYRKKRYINWDSYDKDNAEGALYDIAVWLQSNPRILEDFGDLYHGDELEAAKESKIKRLNNFITENGIRVEAFSTGEPTRGRIFDIYRPDLFVLDDIETTKTKESYAITQNIIGHVDELLGGLEGAQGSILYLGNYISEVGVIAYILDKLKGNDEAVVRNVPVKSPTGVIAWPGKYVETTAEANRLNENRDKRIWLVSLEAKRKLLKNAFEAEMMNNPGASDDKFFDRPTIDHLIARLATIQPPKETAGFKTWGTFDPAHRYGLGADVAEGKGKDSSAIVLIDFGKIPAVQVGSFHSDSIDALSLAHEIKREGEFFGYPMAAPEINNAGHATVGKLREIYPEDRIYQHTSDTRPGAKPQTELGWRTTSGTKPTMFQSLRKAIQDGDLVINDPDILAEMRAFTKPDLSDTGSSKTATRHFDLLIATAIAWQMREHVLEPMEIKAPTPFVDAPTKPLFEEIGL